MGGKSGAGGGGGGAGSVNYPTYIKDMHKMMLFRGTAFDDDFPKGDKLDNSVVSLMNAAMRSTKTILTDLASNGAGTGISSATGGFTSGLTGRQIEISGGSGFTAGTYRIVKYVDTNNITISSSAGASASGGTGIFSVPYQSNTSPYDGVSATNPDTIMFNAAHTISDYAAQNPYELLQLFLAETPESLYTTYASDTAATTMITAFTTDLDAQYTNVAVPAFAAGMADLNATMSSAYNMGLAAIGAQKIREIAKFTGDIKTSVALQRAQMKSEWRRVLSVLSAENARTYLAAKHEATETGIEYSARNILWNLDLLQYGNQTLAAAGGGVVSKSAKDFKPSALGGAMSGAAAGAMVGTQIGAAGGPIGWAGGAAIGGVLGLASTM